MRLGLGLALMLAACGGGTGDDTKKPNCSAEPSESCSEVCDDGVDNNLDELADCDDPTCAASCGEDCTDGIDNDLDGDVDCVDDDCRTTCDKDGDGFLDLFDGGADCNDFNADIHPGAAEICDSLDNDCNGLVDMEDPGLDRDTLLMVAYDDDGDGYGDPNRARQECFVTAGSVANIDDCDDRNPLQNPGMPEICNGLDDNCDGLSDDADPALVLTGTFTYWEDADGDGFGNAAAPDQFCSRPSTHADNDLDCDDTNELILGESGWVQDLDGDGFGSGPSTGPVGCTAPGPGLVSDLMPEDCNDGNAAIHPTALELCNDGIDSDCDTRDCPIFTEDFESGVLQPAWLLSGNANWFVQTGTVHTGSFAGECGNIGNSQTSSMEITVDYTVAGDVSFWHTGDTETGWDYLRFYLDGVQLQQWSGNWSWQQATYPVGAGMHTLKWTYYKDGSVSTGADTVWVDDIALTNATL